MMPSSRCELFRIETLFDARRGRRLVKEDMVPGNANYIGAISSNNGVREHIFAEESDLYPGNCITVNYNGSVGEAFYQPDSFWPSDDVNVLYAKSDWKLDREIGLYIATLIKANRFKFDYGRKWVLEKLLETEIPLPPLKSGKPDWEAVRNYMRSLHWLDNL